jgi:hypothetical protein
MNFCFHNASQSSYFYNTWHRSSTLPHHLEVLVTSLGQGLTVLLWFSSVPQGKQRSSAYKNDYFLSKTFKFVDRGPPTTLHWRLHNLNSHYITKLMANSSLIFPDSSLLSDSNVLFYCMIPRSCGDAVSTELIT